MDPTIRSSSPCPHPLSVQSRRLPLALYRSSPRDTCHHTSARPLAARHPHHTLTLLSAASFSPSRALHPFVRHARLLGSPLASTLRSRTPICAAVTGSLVSSLSLHGRRVFRNHMVEDHSSLVHRLFLAGRKRAVVSVAKFAREGSLGPFVHGESLCGIVRCITAFHFLVLDARAITLTKKKWCELF